MDVSRYLISDFCCSGVRFSRYESVGSKMSAVNFPLTKLFRRQTSVVRSVFIEKGKKFLVPRGDRSVGRSPAGFNKDQEHVGFYDGRNTPSADKEFSGWSKSGASSDELRAEQCSRARQAEKEWIGDVVTDLSLAGKQLTVWRYRGLAYVN
jgi:hypothetical protein